MTKVDGTIGALASMIATNTANRIEALVSRPPIRFSVISAEAPSDRGQRGEQVAEAQGGEVGPDHDQDAGEADRLRRPAAPAHLLAEQRRPRAPVTRIGAANRIA